jgi:hypothetical protein
MKKNILTIVLLTISLVMVLVGCGESKASTPEKFMKDILSSNSLKNFSVNVLDGDKYLEEMSDSKKETAEGEIKTYRESIKNNEAEFKVLNSNTDSKYIRVAYYKKALKPTSEKKMDVFYITKVDGKYKLDSSINGINKIDLITYESEGDRTVTDFKVYAKLGKEYKYEFNSLKDQYYSIDIGQVASSSILHGYIKKDSEDGKKLYELLKDGAEMQVTLSISIPDWVEANRDIFLIEGFKTVGWATE